MNNINEGRKLELTQGKFALVDERDYEWLMKYKWHANKTGRLKNREKWYAFSTKRIVRTIMHRTIWEHHNGEIPKNIYIDHINGDGLDNRIANLRLATPGENQNNRPSYHGKSKYKGVYWNNYVKKWCVGIYKDRKHFHLGYFVSEIEAAKAYNEGAKIHHKEFAVLNKV